MFMIFFQTGTPPTGPRRGPGRPRKIRPPEEVNVTIPAPPSDLSDSRLSFDSFTESNTASPVSIYRHIVFHLLMGIPIENAKKEPPPQTLCHQKYIVFLNFSNYCLFGNFWV